MYVKRFTKMVPVDYFLINDREFKVNEVLEVLDDLDNPSSDGVVIYDWVLLGVLVDMKVVEVTARGSALRGPNLRCFMDIVDYHPRWDWPR